MTEQVDPAHQRIRQSLQGALAPTSLDVIDESHKHAKHAHMIQRSGSARGTEETHFRIKVVAEVFRGKTRLERHRAIYSLLSEEIGPDKVHALAIEARAPGE